MKMTTDNKNRNENTALTLFNVKAMFTLRKISRKIFNEIKFDTKFLAKFLAKFD